MPKANTKQKTTSDKPKANPKKKITLDKLNDISQKLGELEEKQKSEFNLRESVYRLSKQLRDALKLGYSYADLVKLLEEQDITISPTTLKQYLSTSPNKSRKRKKRTNSKSSDNSLNTESTQPSSTKNKAVYESDNLNKATENKNQSTTKTVISSGLNEDLSSEFNKY